MFVLKDWYVIRAGAGMTIEGTVVAAPGEHTDLLATKHKITRVSRIESIATKGIGSKIVATRDTGEKAILE